MIIVFLCQPSNANGYLTVRALSFLSYFWLNYNLLPWFYLLLANMYQYEGRDYSKESSSADQKTFEQLLELNKMVLEDSSKGGRSLRTKSNVSWLSSKHFIVSKCTFHKIFSGILDLLNTKYPSSFIH